MNTPSTPAAMLRHSKHAPHKSLSKPQWRSKLASMLGALFLLLASGGAHAATDTPDTSLFDTFGKREGVVRLTDDFVNRMAADARIAAMFKESNLRRVKEKLAEQLCVVTGGPCTYTGDSMSEVHKSMGVQMKDFNAVVEILQDAMQAQQIPFGAQNRLLALLAPMYRDMVKP